MRRRISRLHRALIRRWRKEHEESSPVGDSGHFLSIGSDGYAWPDSVECSSSCDVHAYCAMVNHTRAGRFTAAVLTVGGVYAQGCELTEKQAECASNGIALVRAGFAIGGLFATRAAADEAAAHEA